MDNMAAKMRVEEETDGKKKLIEFFENPSNILEDKMNGDRIYRESQK